MRKKKTSSPAKQLHIYIYICGGKLLGCSAGVQIREVLALYPYLGLESRPLDSSPLTCVGPSLPGTSIQKNKPIANPV